MTDRPPPRPGNFVPARSYLELRPERIGDAVRLYWAFALASVHRALRPASFVNIGRHIPGKELVQLREGSCRVYARPGTDDLAYWVHGHKPATERWFRPESGQMVLDIGAHLGFFDIRASEAGARVIAFEPNPGSFDLLSRIVRENHLDSVVVDPRAISDEAGTRAIYECAPVPGMSSLDSHWMGPAPPGKIRRFDVPVATLDAIAGELAIRAVDWLLVDVEGSESAVLRGGRQTLGRTRRVIIELAEETEEAAASELSAAGLRPVEQVRQTRRTKYGLYVRPDATTPS